jgi:hypothetical protein
MHSLSAKIKRVAIAASVTGLVFMQTASAATSSWKPTLLVNTESFQTIDEGDGTSNIVIKFGQTLLETLTFDRTKNRFQFSRGLSVLGTLSGSALNIDRNITAGGKITATGSITTSGTLSGAVLRISGPADVQGALTASGTIRTDSDLTINDDAGAVDAVLTFGNNTANQTLKFLNGTQRFQFSKGISVIGHMSGSSLNVDRNITAGGKITATGAITTSGRLSGASLRVSGPADVQGNLSASGTIRTEGNLSGSTLNVDGTINWHGQSYVGPTSQTNGTFLKTDGAGNLTWTAITVGNGSGGIISAHPSYPNAIYFASGSNMVGQLTASGGTSALDNSYVWTSSRSSIQDYWISVRVRLPDNFSSWDVIKPIELRYKTGVAAAANNHVTMRIKDTTGAAVALTSGGGLSNVAWTTANITGPQASGTWAARGYITIYIKLATDNTAAANAAVGFLNLNYETTTP